MRRYIQVAVPVPLHRTLTYGLKPEQDARPGVRVRVPLGRRSLVGIVVSEATDVLPTGLKSKQIRAISEVLDPEPILGPAVRHLCQWVVDYYHSPPGMAYALALPPGLSGGSKGKVQPLKMQTQWWATPLGPQTGGDAAEANRPRGAKMDRALSWLQAAGVSSAAAVRGGTGAGLDVLKRLETRGFITLESREVPRDPFAGMTIEPDTPRALTEEQGAATAAIDAASGAYQGFLLDGVTGSGKTEVYLSAIAKVLDRGQTALVLVPEIALTPQLASRFRARFGEKVAVQHSGLAAQARLEQWSRIASGELPVVVGARSAVFAPAPNLGLIVVDEEHDGSFKQDSAPPYHGRDLALVRGAHEGCPVVLGTATPSLESWANIARGKLTLIQLTERVHARPMPPVALIDLSLKENATIDEGRMVSAPLRDAISETLERGEQAIILVNRRGFAAFILCRACGKAVTCPDCSVSYTWHRGRDRLVCHYCDRVAPRPQQCPNADCRDDLLEDVGFGAERVVDTMKGLFPKARIGRMDRDTTRGKALGKLLDAVRARDIDILVGTQMVAKGHDFPFVTLVGVLLAEQGLGMPDIHSVERTFQLLAQVAGRAGRAELPGRVLIQTRQPDHYALQHASRHDAHGFLDDELRERRARNHPPTAHHALYRLQGPRADRVHAACGLVYRTLRQHCAQMGARGEGIVVLAPMPAVIERIKARIRFQILIQSPSRGALQRLLAMTELALDDTDWPPGVQRGLDVDPRSML